MERHRITYHLPREKATELSRSLEQAGYRIVYGGDNPSFKDFLVFGDGVEGIMARTDLRNYELVVSATTPKRVELVNYIDKLTLN